MYYVFNETVRLYEYVSKIIFTIPTLRRAQDIAYHREPLTCEG